MNEERNSSVGTISQLILEFDDHWKKLDGIKKELIGDIVPKLKPSPEWAIVLLAIEWIENIATVLSYEKVLLHFVISMDDNLQERFDVYSSIRVFHISHKVRDYYARLQGAREDITERNASDVIRKAIEIVKTSFDLIQRTARLYEAKEDSVSLDGETPGTVIKIGDKNGISTAVFEDGEIFISESRDGVPSGFATVLYPDGTRYIGEVDCHTYKGHGILTVPSGANYVGEFSNDKFNGQGAFIDAEGYEYKGKWEDGILLSQEVGAGPYHHPSSGILFPEKLAAMGRAKVSNYELTKPGGGISVAYDNDDTSINGTIYVYTLGFQNLDSQSEVFATEKTFHGAISDIYAAYESGVYSSVVKLTEGRTSLGDFKNNLEVFSASFMLSQYGMTRFSHLYVGRHQHQFLKIRFTYNETVEREGKQTLELFCRETVGLLS